MVHLLERMGSARERKAATALSSSFPFAVALVKFAASRPLPTEPDDGALDAPAPSVDGRVSDAARSSSPPPHVHSGASAPHRRLSSSADDPHLLLPPVRRLLVLSAVAVGPMHGRVHARARRDAPAGW